MNFKKIATMLAGSALLAGALASNASADPRVYVYPNRYSNQNYQYRVNNYNPRVHQYRANRGQYRRAYPQRYYRRANYSYPYQTYQYNQYSPYNGYRYTNGRYYDRGNADIRIGPLRIDL